MKLLKYEGYNLTFEPEILTLRVFKRLFMRDKTKDKSRFLQELGYIYFMLDPRSDYMYITDNEERSKAIIEGEGLPDTWKVDSALQDAMEYYKSFRPTSALLLEDTRIAVDKVREFLRTVDLTAEDEKGKPKHTIQSVTTAIKQIPQLAKDLAEAEKALAKEIEEQSKARGNSEMSLFDNGINVE